MIILDKSDRFGQRFSHKKYTTPFPEHGALFLATVSLATQERCSKNCVNCRKFSDIEYSIQYNKRRHPNWSSQRHGYGWPVEARVLVISNHELHKVSSVSNARRLRKLMK